jgi:hypothetical protein
MIFNHTVIFHQQHYEIAPFWSAGSDMMPHFENKSHLKAILNGFAVAE